MNKGNISGIIAIIFWSVSPLLVIASSNVPVFQLGFLTLGFASLMSFFKYTFLDKISLIKILKQPFKAYALTVSGIGGYIACWYLAFQNAPPFAANTLNYLWPILLMLLCMLSGREGFSLSKLLGLILGFLGISLIFIPSLHNSFSIDYFYGYIFALLGAGIWALYSYFTFYIKFENYAMSSLLFFAAMCMLTLHMLFEEFYSPTSTEIFFIGLLGITRISFSFWDYAMKNGTVSLVSSLSYFIPVTSTLLLVMFNFLPSNIYMFFGGSMVLTGCLIVNLGIFKK